MSTKFTPHFCKHIELICQQNPDFFLFENVKGLWKTKKHRTFFEELKRKLLKSGYVLVERLINPIEYGVPQDRERIILIGFRINLLKHLGIKTNSYIGILPKAYFPWDKYKEMFPKNHLNASIDGDILPQLVTEIMKYTYIRIKFVDCRLPKHSLSNLYLKTLFSLLICH